MNLFVQIIGYAAVLVSFFIFQQKDRKRVLLLKLLDDVLWATHFYLLGGFTNAYTTIVAIFREGIFYNKDKAWAKNKIWIVIFTIFFVAVGITGRDGVYSIFPVINSTLSTVGFWSNSTKRTKLLILPGAFGMALYSVRYHSMSSLLAQVITILSIAVFFLREYGSKRKEAAAAKSETHF